MALSNRLRDGFRLRNDEVAVDMHREENAKQILMAFRDAVKSDKLLIGLLLPTNADGGTADVAP